MNPIATILTALRSIRFGASVLVAGVVVVRSSLLGFDVAGQRGLDASEALGAIEAAVVDASWPAPMSLKRHALKSTKPLSFYGKMTLAVLPHRGVYGMNLRMVRDGVAISVSAGKGVSADEHRLAASFVAEALRNDGHAAIASGSDVLVLAA